MTNEERQRTMEFILEQQAQFAANIQRHEENFRQLEEERIRDRPRMAELERSFQRLVQLAEIHDIRLDGVESSTATLEDAFRRLDRLVKKSEARLARLESKPTRLDNST